MPGLNRARCTPLKKLPTLLTLLVLGISSMPVLAAVSEQQAQRLDNGELTPTGSPGRAVTTALFLPGMAA